MSKILENGVSEGPLTTSLTTEVSPEMLLSEVDRRVLRVRPMATPIDQISRLGGTRRSGSMVVEYYRVESKETSAKVTTGFGGAAHEEGTVYQLDTANNALFAPSSTLLVSEALVKENPKEPLVLYVVEAPLGQPLKVMPVNIPMDDDCPAVTAGMTVVCMGRAAGELDVQTAQFEALPQKSQNLCQIFKAQVEESTIQRLTDKEVGWGFSDQEEIAVVDLRMGIEKSLLFGVKRRLKHPVTHEEILLTGGIWHQAGREWHYNSQTNMKDGLLELLRTSFTGSGGSRRKVLVAGSDLIDKLNALDYVKVIGASEKVSRWGIDFTELQSKFGSLYVAHCETFDRCGYAGCGMVIDPQYLTKYAFIPMHAQRLDLKKSGQRNTDAVVITEASCLVLRYPNAHVRVIAD